MNRIYRLVFNAAHGLLQVASEHARGHGRGKLPDQTSTESLRNVAPSGNRATLQVAIIMALAAAPMSTAWAVTYTVTSTIVGGLGSSGQNGTSTSGGAGGPGGGDGNNASITTGSGGSGFAPSSTNPGYDLGNNGSGGAAAHGGAGGGGGSLPTIGGGGGGGGGGGNGYVLSTGSSLSVMNTNAEIAGGLGGNGGDGSGNAYGGNGGGGGGGNGIMAAPSTIVTNNGTIIGGNGGIGGQNSLTGNGGDGGVGIVATGNVVVNNSATIIGGKADGGADFQAAAIGFSGGGNILEIEAGSRIIGNVISTSGTTNGGDTLVLGGSTSPGASFNVSNVQAKLPATSTGTQYVGFNKLEENASTGTIWTITGTNTSGLGWNLDGGILSVSSAGALGNYTTTFNGGTLETTQSLTDAAAMTADSNGGTVNNDGNTDTLSGVISGAGGMALSGTGTTTLSGANTYSGGTTLNGGTTSISAANNLGSGAITFNGGTLLTTAGITSSNNIVVNAAGGTINNDGNSDILAGSITNATDTSASLIFDGTGTTTLDPSLGTGTDALGGGAIINGGTLQLEGVNEAGASIQISGSESTTTAGAGISGSGFSLGNEVGIIQGGQGNGNYSTGGAGIVANASTGGPDRISNSGSGNILGGHGGVTTGGVPGYGTGGNAITATGNVSIYNDHMVAGGIGGGIDGGGGVGGDGILASANNQQQIVIDNNTGATIEGGQGGSSSSGDIAGTGIVASGNVLIFNASGALITGTGGGLTASSYVGGVGINASSGVGVDNSGLITGNGGTSVNDGGTAIIAHGTAENNVNINNNTGGIIEGGTGENVQGSAAIVGSAFTLINSGTISGGNENVTSPPVPQQLLVLGDGVEATGNDTIVNAGAIDGGGSTYGTGFQSDAIDFSGGGNTLILQNGYSFQGNVVSTSGTTNGGDTLVLGGSTNPGASFNVSNVQAKLPATSTGTQYVGFNKLEENASTGTIWTITGTNTSGLGWNLDGGILSVSSAGALGNYTTTFNGGTLKTTQSLTDAAAITTDSNGGTVNNDGNTDTLSGVISGVGGMTFSGTGTTTLSGSNTYQGGTTIDKNTQLYLGNGGSTGSVVGDITDNGILGFVQSGTVVASNNISGSGEVAQTGSGTLILSGDNTYLGGTFIAGGTVSISKDSNLGGNSMTMFDGTLETTSAIQDAINIVTDGGGEGGGTTLSGTVNNDGNTDSLSGVISGAGGMTFSGTGTTTLSGTNTYSGGTTINGGTTSIGAANNLGTGGITFNGGTLKTTQSLTDAAAMTADSNGGTVNNDGKTDTLSGVISGAGGMTFSGTGTTTLSGANTYSGGTTINGGTTSIGAANNLGSGAITFNGGSLLTTAGITSSNNIVVNPAGGTVNNDGNTDILSGVISGAGGMTFSGTGTTTLSGANAYSGGTTINGGTTSIGAANNLGTGGITFNGGTLETTQSLTDAAAMTADSNGGTVNNDGNADSLSGVISGAGGMTFSGTGTTTLSGANTYSGGTTINGGTTSIGAANNLGTGGITFNGGTLASNASASSIALTNALTMGSSGGELIGTSQTSLDPTTSNALTLTGKISGSGALQTDGTIIDNGSGGTTGGTTLKGGLLEVGDASTPGATLSGPVTVDSGAVLRGHGTIDGNVTNGGTVFPGGTIGILTVDGNYVQNPDGTLNIEVTPNDSTPGVGYDQLNVTGKAALAGNLAVQVDPGAYTVGEQYNIVHAGQGVSGIFSKVVYAPLFASYITPTVTYGAQGVYLNLTANPIAFNSGKAVPDNAYIVNQSLQGAMTRIFSAHKGIWAQGIGGFGRANGASVADYGGVMGDGVAITSQLTLGAAFSGLGTQTSTGYQQVDGRSFGFYGYGIYTQGHLRVSGALGTGYLSLNEQRALHPTPAIASGSSKGWFFAAGTQARYLIPLSKATFLMPYGAMSYLHTGTNAFTERGAGNLDIAYAGQSTDLGIFSGGLRAGTALRAGHLTWTPWVEVGGTGYAGNRRMNTLESIGTNINLTSNRIAPADSLDTGAGVTLRGQGHWETKMAYVGQFAGDTHFNTFDITANYRW